MCVGIAKTLRELLKDGDSIVRERSAHSLSIIAREPVVCVQCACTIHLMCVCVCSYHSAANTSWSEIRLIVEEIRCLI